MATGTRAGPVLVATGAALTAVVVVVAGLGLVVAGAAVFVGALAAVVVVVAAGLGLAATAVPTPEDLLSTALYSTAGLACKS